MSRHDRRKRSESKLVRLDNRTVELLEALRRSSPLHYSGYGALVRELAVKELERRGIHVVGIPTPPKIPPGGATPAPAPAPFASWRSAAGGGAAPRGR